jgi:hypothetical protein
MKPLGTIDADEANKILVENWESAYITSPIGHEQKEHHVLALEVKKLGDDSRAMINVPFVRKRTEIETWLETIIDPLGNIVKKYIDDVFDAFYNKIVLPSIKKGSSEPTKSVSKQLEVLIKKDVILKAKHVAFGYANNLVDSVKINTYTTNDHYLTATKKDFEETYTKDFLGLSRAYQAKMEPFFHVVCELRAFIKTRKKVLPDTIQLHFTKVLDNLHKATKKEIDNQMMSESSIAMIKESDRIVKKREFYLQREKSIMDALEEISLL